jgi:hypothetical protein
MSAESWQLAMSGEVGDEALVPVAMIGVARKAKTERKTATRILL